MSEPSAQTPPVPLRAGALALVLFGLALGADQLLRAPPPPGSGAAWAHLSALVGAGLPAPLGSQEHGRRAAYARRVLAEAGYAVEEQRRFVCSDLGACGAAYNLLAELPGQDRGRVVLVLAHLDTVAASPGAWDNAAGVAALLAAARSLAQRPAGEVGVLFLLDDGEEDGVLGAEAFAQHHPRAAAVQAVINVDGLGGPSVLYPQGPAERWPRAALSGLPRPFVSSLFGGLELLRGGFDSSRVFLGRGLPCWSLAGFGDAAHYHTRLDRLEHVDPAWLAHKGELLTTLIERLTAPGGLRPGPRGAFVDLASRGVLELPRAALVLLALAGVALSALALSARGLREALGALALLALLAAALWGLGYLALAAGGRFASHPVPQASEVRLLGAGALLLAALAWLLSRARPPAALAWLLRRPRPSPPAALAALLVPALVSTWTVWRHPEEGLAPALGVALAAGSLHAAGRWPRAARWAAALTPGLLLLLLASPLRAVLAVVGPGRAWLLAALAAVAALAFLPALLLDPLPRRGAAALAALGVGLSLLAAVQERAFAGPWPSTLRLEQGAGRARLLLDGAPFPGGPAVREARAYPWSSGGRQVFTATTTPAAGGEEPRAVVLSQGPGRVRLRVWARPAARQLTLALSPALGFAGGTVQGAPLALSPANVAASGGHRLITVYAPSPDGMEVELALAAPAAAPLLLFDVAPGLDHPAVALRPPSLVPQGVGDASSRWIALRLD